MLIGANWKIETDSLNVILLRRSAAKKGKHAGQEIWKRIAYYPTLQYALKYLVDREIQELK